MEESVRERVMRIKETRAQSPRSIAIAGYGRAGYDLGMSLLNLNKYVRDLNRSLLTRGFQEVSRVYSELKDFETEIWTELKRILPAYLTYETDRWFDFTQTKEEKLTLARRRNSFIIDPENDTIASILIAVKVLYENYNKFTGKEDLEKLQGIVSLLERIKRRVNEILDAKKGKQA